MTAIEDFRCIACIIEEKEARIYKVVNEREKKTPKAVGLENVAFVDVSYQTKQLAWNHLLGNGFFLDLAHVGIAIAKQVKEGIEKRKAVLSDLDACLPDHVKIYEWYHAEIHWKSSDPRFTQLDHFDETDYLLSSEKTKNAYSTP